MEKKNLESLCERAICLGAGDCKVIDASTVKTAAWVRYKCQFGCDGFGDSLTCPPHSPTPEQTQKILDCFKKAVLIYCEGRSKKDISDIALEIEKQAFFAGYYKALAMGAGPCRLCQSCDTTALCKHAYKARPSMEACGIDVFTTARVNGFKIETLDSPQCKANYFALVLVE
jgi:predicted metal-binding protein